MQSHEQLIKDWWAEGDTPVHRDSHVTYLVDGRMAMLSMCQHFLKARKYIYLANWGMTPGSASGNTCSKRKTIRWLAYT